MAIVESCDADAVSQAQLSHNIAIANASTQPTVSNSSYTKEGTALGSSDTSPNLPLDLLPPKSLSWIEQELRDTWNAEETRRKMREKEVLCEREEKSHEAILISYQKYATDEDKELVDGWNENLNILLTFVGRSSGVTFRVSHAITSKRPVCYLASLLRSYYKLVFPFNPVLQTPRTPSYSTWSCTLTHQPTPPHLLLTARQLLYK